MHDGLLPKAKGKLQKVYISIEIRERLKENIYRLLLVLKGVILE